MKTTPAMYAAEVETSSRAKDAVTKEAWLAIKAAISPIKLPSSWQCAWHDSSVTFSNHKRGIHMKIQLDGQIFVDTRRRDMSYSSERLKFESIIEASNHIHQLLNRYSLRIVE